MRLVTTTAARDYALLTAANASGTEARTQIATLAPTVLLRVMTAHNWSEVQVECESISLIEAVYDHAGTEVGLSNGALAELNDEAFAIVGQCPRRIFRYEHGSYWVDTTAIVEWLNG